MFLDFLGECKIMALESTRTLEQLSDECMTRGLSVTPSGKNGKYKKEDYIRALRSDYLVEQYGEIGRAHV